LCFCAVSAWALEGLQADDVVLAVIEEVAHLLVLFCVALLHLPEVLLQGHPVGPRLLDLLGVLGLLGSESRRHHLLARTRVVRISSSDFRPFLYIAYAIPQGTTMNTV